MLISPRNPDLLLIPINPIVNPIVSMLYTFIYHSQLHNNQLNLINIVN
jgi:hypothetical protein